jgi:hypothetical protein
MWFYAALFGLLLGHRLDTPFFTAPTDAMLYSLPALFTLLATAPEQWPSTSSDIRFPLGLAITWSLFVFLLSSMAIAISRKHDGYLGNTRQFAATLCTTIGTPRLFFSVILGCLLAAFPPETGRGALCIAAVWGITVPFSILDSGWYLVRRLRTNGLNRDSAEIVMLESFQQPGLLTLRAPRAASVTPGTVVAYRDSVGDKGFALCMGLAGRDTGNLVRAVDIGMVDSTNNTWQFGLLGRMEALRVADDDLPADKIASTEKIRQHCVGFIAPESDINSIAVNITTDRPLAAGSVISITMAEDEVFYQLTNGILKEEMVQNRNAFGYVTAWARCVGRWSISEQRFLPVNWVPTPNSPAILVESRTEPFQKTCIGSLPETGFRIHLSQASHLVTHNTAILGILGVGKSMLAMELIERVLAEQCKVVVLDVTGQYVSELSDIFDSAYNEAVAASLREIGPPGKETISMNVEEGGSRQEFANACKQKLHSFMTTDSAGLLILNPATFQVWKQDSRVFSNSAAMAQLTACEITGLFSEAALEVVQDLGLSDSARLCMVYEEAHALIPEFNATVGDGEKAASNRTARAILQGRKYGLGCIVITQRTANVTKTILNQCNTIFAMRSFDDTGRDFLANFIGRDYSASLTTLREREAIFFGRASSCENPVRISLNNRTEFIAGFRGDGNPSSDHSETT